MRRKIIGGVLLVILAAAIVAVIWIVHAASVAPVTRVAGIVAVAPPRTDAPNIPNPANERIANLTSTEQAAVLGKAIGRGCTGVAAFPMGIGSHDADRGDAYWSVKCADGKSYAVTLHPDKAGTVGVLDCDAVHAAGITCFKHLPPG
ncbi:MAG TPA: hypothetical protein VN668_15380 [Stellaceae bacterium]|nr:hypothetical protein [Stellaceae bacterium]